MNWRTMNIKKRLHLVAAVILLVGLGSAALIYLAADNDLDRELGYEVISGHVYPVRPEDSKTFMHDMELYGGKMNVLANEIMRWFTGLWHGKSLAHTVAGIAIFISLTIFCIATHSQADADPASREESDTVGPG